MTRPRPARVRAVWCDVGGVLTSSVADAFTALCAAAGVPPEALRAAVAQVALADGLTGLGALERGMTTQRAWGRRVAEILEPQWKPAVDLGDFGVHFYRGRRAEPAVLGALAAARARGLRVGLLTNSVREWEPLRQELLGDLPFVETTLNSYEVGLCKPERAMFELAEATFGVVGDQCLLVDDMPENCEAAQARGWAAIEHRDAATTARLLDEFCGPVVGATGLVDRTTAVAPASSISASEP